MINIRPFVEADAHDVVGLILPIQQREFAIPITLDAQPDLQDVAGFYQHGSGNFWVAEDNGKVIGTVGLLDIGDHQAALRKMFVSASYRGAASGVAGRLLQTLWEWCQTRDVRAVYLGTTDKFLAAHRFYAKQGFREISRDALPARFPVMEVDSRFFCRTMAPADARTRAEASMTAPVAVNIRPIETADWPAVWALLHATFRAGDTYSFSPDSSEAEIHKAWVELPAAAFVACADDGSVLGTYFIKANQPGLGAHVCNCGYVVAPAAQGRGIAAAMCVHSQARAVEMGFRAMQYNLVVATNERAVRLWQRLGFSVVGTLPGAFHHRRLGYVDAFVMYKTLVG